MRFRGSFFFLSDDSQFIFPIIYFRADPDGRLQKRDRLIQRPAGHRRQAVLQVQLRQIDKPPRVRVQFQQRAAADIQMPVAAAELAAQSLAADALDCQGRLLAGQIGAAA